MADILKIGQSGLTAAQIGMATTGHNISNANTPGYTRQIVVQGAVNSQDSGFGFVGKGTEVTAIRRVYDEFLNNQVVSAQTGKSQLDSYYSQIQQVNNMLADSTAGLSPALQDFFSSVQTASSDANNAASRQSMLSSAQTLTSRFQNMNGQLSEINAGVNNQITASVSDINAYAKQLAALNDAIEKASTSMNHTPNDLLDQRDQLINDLSKTVKVSVVKQENSYNVFIGNGQPLVVGNASSQLITMNSPTDPSRLEVGYKSGGVTILIPEEGMSGGGSLGGLFDFRAQTLDVARNSLGRVAIGLADSFNQQHRLGQDQQGVMGGDFFNIAAPQATSGTANTGSGVMTASISNAGALTISDYSVRYDGTAANYTVTRLSDGATTTFANFPKTIDGVDFNLASGTVNNGDSFLIKPTANGASSISVAVTDKSKIALASPVTTSTVSTNTGTAKISAGVTNASTLMAPFTLNFDSTAGTLSGFPSGLPIVVTSGGTPTTYPAGSTVPYATGDSVSFGGVSLSGIPTAADAAYNFSKPNATLNYDVGAGGLTGFPPYMDVAATTNGVTTTYPAGTPVPYSPPTATTLSFGGVSITISGVPADGDVFKVGSNASGVGDNRNGLLLTQLQTASTLDGGTTNFQGAYSQLVNTIGNKTRELQVTSTAAANQYTQAVQNQQSESGVNLDEEAANLLRYQQAYQAAAKIMQTASKMFDVLLTLGG